MADDLFHLFPLPSILGVLYESDIQFAPGFETNSSGLGALDALALIDAAEPALRALVLLGYYPLTLEFATAAAPGASRIVFDLNEFQVSALEAEGGAALPDPHDIWGSGNTDLTLVIGVIPFWGPGLQPATFDLGFPESGGSWFVVAPDTSTTGTPDPVVDRTEVVFTVPAGRGGNNLAGALEAHALADFKAAVVAELIPKWQTGVAPGSSGLLFLFDPDNWFHPDFDHNLQSRVIRRIGEHGLLPPTASPGQIETFLTSQLSGDMLAEQVLFMATERETRSRTRARRLVKAMRKWSERDDWPSSDITDSFQLAVDTLGWMDLLMLMGELNAFTYPALFSSGIIVTAPLDDLEPEACEPLIGVRLSDHGVALSWYGLGATGTDAEQYDPYGEILRLVVAPDLAIPDPDNPEAVLPETRTIEECCTWEFIPANAENPLPRLIVLAAPGVTITRHANLDILGLEVEIHRKNDYLLPPWGAPILLAQVFGPEVIRLAEPPVFETTPAAFVIVHEQNKTTVNYYHEFPSPEALQQQSQLTQPNTAIEITLVDPLSPACGYRVDADFVKSFGSRHSPETIDDVFLSAVMRVIRCGTNVEIRMKQEFGGIVVSLFEAGDLNTLYCSRPDFIPLDVIENVYDPQTDTPVERWSEADYLGYGLTRYFLPSDMVEDTTPFTTTLALMLFEIGLGFTPVGDALDLAEFAYAWNTGYDRWHRPVRGYELVLMGAGAGMPIISSSLLRGSGDGLGAITRLWRADASDEAVEAARGVLARAKVGDSVLGMIDDVLRPLISGASEVAGKTALELGDLLNSTSRGFVNPSLQRAFRKWRALDFPDVTVVP